MLHGYLGVKFLPFPWNLQPKVFFPWHLTTEHPNWWQKAIKIRRNIWNVDRKMHFINIQLMTEIEVSSIPKIGLCLYGQPMHFLSLHKRKRQMLSADVHAEWAPVLMLRATGKRKQIPFCVVRNCKYASTCLVLQATPVCPSHFPIKKFPSGSKQMN